MDNPLMSVVTPLIILANHYQFSPNESVRNGPVHSCMLLWCRTGRGAVEIDGQPYALPPGHALLLPWRHTVRYTAHRTEPFLVSGIHVIPGASTAVAHRFGLVSHLGQALEGQGAGVDPLGARVHALDLGEHPALRHCAEYALACYMRVDRQESGMRILGEQLLHEWAVALARRSAPEPAALRRARNFVQMHVGRRLDRALLARSAGVSPATLQRLTMQHLHLSPMAWAQRLRLEAATALLEGANLPLRELAERFGFYDAFHFSRAFKRLHGLSPRRWRAQRALLGDG